MPKEKSPIPKIIHYIWVGGPLRINDARCIRRMQKANKDYAIWLWYDSEHMIAYDLGAQIRKAHRGDPTKLQKALVSASVATNANRLKMLTELTGKDANYMVKENIRAMSTYAPAGVHVKDARANVLKAMDNKFYYELEMTNRGGNFGAASDVLRIELLRKFGGVYMDLDLAPKGALGKLHCYTHFSLVGFTQGRESNALLGSHPQSEFMRLASGKIAQNYKDLAAGKGAAKSRALPMGVDFDMYYSQDVQTYKSATIALTGPSVLRPVMDILAQRELDERKQEWQKNKPKKKPLTKEQPYKPEYASVYQLKHGEMRFPNVIEFNTEEQKETTWAPKE